MNIPSSRPFAPLQIPRKSAKQLKSEVSDLTEQTDQWRDRLALSVSATATAGLATAFGGALTLLDATHSIGLKTAGFAGAALACGLGLCAYVNARTQASEARRLGLAGELFDARKGR